MSVTPWMQTYSGKAVDILDPKPEQISLMDIAVSLSRTPRYNGHTNRARIWSVAQHSLVCERLLSEDCGPLTRLHVLLHDAHEAYLGDLIRPVILAIEQRSEGAFKWKWLTDTMDAAIYAYFGIPMITPEQRIVVRDIDNKVGYAEKTLFMDPEVRPWDWYGGQKLPDIPGGFRALFVEKPPEDVRTLFCGRVSILLSKYVTWAAR
jgi:uncharacterized protein